MMPQINLKINDFSKIDTNSNDGRDSINSTKNIEENSFKSKLHKELNKSQEKNTLQKESTTIEKNIEDKDLKDSEGENLKDDIKNVSEQLMLILEKLLNENEKIDTKSLKTEDLKDAVSMISEILKDKPEELSKIREFLKNNKIQINNIEETFLKGKDFNEELKDLLSMLNENEDLLNYKLKNLIEKTMNKLAEKLTNKDINLNKNIASEIKNQINVKDENNINKTLDLSFNKESISKDEKFLNGLLENDTSYKNTKALMFGSMNNENVSDKKATSASNLNIGMPDIKNFSLNNVETTETNMQPTIINKNSMAQDVIKNIKFMEVANLKELTVKINPKDLGEIIIKLSLENNEMKAKIVSGNKDTYNMLNSNLNEIKNSLLSQNLRVNDISVDVYLQDSTTYSDFKEGEGYNEGHKQNSYKTTEDSSDITDESLDYEAQDIYKDNNINMLA